MHSHYPIILFYRDINNIIFRIFIAIRNIFRKIYLHWFFVITKPEKGYGKVVKTKKPWKHNQMIQLSRFWRRERDSNPWTANAVNGFRDRPVRPLRHLSVFGVQKYNLFFNCGNLFYLFLFPFMQDVVILFIYFLDEMEKIWGFSSIFVAVGVSFW